MGKTDEEWAAEAGHWAASGHAAMFLTACRMAQVNVLQALATAAPQGPDNAEVRQGLDATRTRLDKLANEKVLSQSRFFAGGKEKFVANMEAKPGPNGALYGGPDMITDGATHLNLDPLILLSNMQGMSSLTDFERLQIGLSARRFGGADPL